MDVGLCHHGTVEFESICSAESGNAAKASCHVLKPKAESDPWQFKQERNDEKVEDWKEKPLHGQFLRQTESVTSNLSWTWLKQGEFKK